MMIKAELRNQGDQDLEMIEIFAVKAQYFSQYNSEVCELSFRLPVRL